MNMPHRKILIATNQIYHVFNRGVAHIPIFTDTRDYRRFLQTAQYYNDSQEKLKFSHSSLLKVLPEESIKKSKIVDILAFCLMPNHFHFMLKQLTDSGITRFITQLSNSYSHYFNTKHDRSGPLFNGPYKAVLVNTDEQLIHLSRYIHLNPIAANLVKNLESYQWSSYQEYLEPSGEKLASPELVLEFFKSGESYKQFLLDQVEYAKELEKIKHITID